MKPAFVRYVDDQCLSRYHAFARHDGTVVIESSFDDDDDELVRYIGVLSRAIMLESDNNS